MPIFRPDLGVVNPDDELLSVHQVAKVYGVVTRTVFRWEAKGLIPRGRRITRQTIRWLKSELATTVVVEGDK